MYAYGGGIVTFFSTFNHLLSGGFINAFIEYFINSALPPSSIEHVIFQIMVGSVAAGIKWYLAVAVFR
ncbi:MAG: hypothetical protein PHV51_00585 [Methanosarcinaceae archaeon]|nr:hypothetical protein [Methanosarcinaceae archaeon]